MNKLTALALLLAAATAHASITGTVVDENGKPLAGATIRVYPSEPTREWRRRILSPKPEREPLSSATSKDDGTFSADAKGTAAVDLRFESGARRRVLSVPDGVDLGPVLMREPVQRSFKVTAGGKPVANALIVFNASQFTRSDATGSFSTGEATSSFATVIHPDFAIEGFPLVEGRELRLQLGETVRGRVLGANGKPSAKAAVFVNGWELAESGDDGAFTIAHAPANWQTVLAVSGADAGLATRGGAIEIRLRRGSVVSGAVRDSLTGEAVPGAIVSLGRNDMRNEQQSVPADAKGRFAFPPMPQGNYALGGQHWAYAIEGASFPLAESVTRGLAARPHARIYGRVVDEQRKPVAGALIAGTGPFDSTKRTISDSAGNFVLRFPEQQQRLSRVYALKRGFATGLSPTWMLKPGQVIKDVVVTLPKGFPLQVRVLDRAKKPVAGVRIGLSQRDEQQGSPAACDDPAREACTLSDANGIVAWRLVEGDYFLSARGDVAKIVPVNRQITLNAASSPYALDVEAGALVTGKVVFADGKPVPNAEVAIDEAGRRDTVNADDGGFFIIDSLPPERTTLAASTADRRLTSLPLEVTPPASNVTITMPRGGRIEGRVTERGGGQPVADFTISVQRRGVGFGGFEGAQLFHAEDGAFALDNVAPGNVAINVAANGFVTASRTGIVVEEGATAQNVEVQLDRGARLAGRVTAGGKPLAGVAVMGSMAGGSFGSGGPARAVTDADGEYTLEGVAAGERTFDFRKTGYVSSKKTVELAASKETRLDVELDRGRELRGRVVDGAGAGVAGANVVAQSGAGFGRGGDDGRTLTDADGSFVIEGLAESRYNVTARKTGYASANERDVDVPVATPLTLTLKSGATLTGRVTGLPERELAGVNVTAYATGQSSSAQAQTDSTGAFTVRGVPDGQVTVQASTQRGARRAIPKTITVAGGSAPPVELDFAEGYSIHGKVTMNGVPVEFGSINFFPIAQTQARQFVPANINNGTYEASGLGAGEYRVTVMGGEVRFEERIQVTGSTTRDFDIRGANVRGRVVDATGAPVPNAMISMAAKAPMGGRGAQSDSDGRFLLAAVADDTYTITVVAQPYAPAKKEVVVAGGTAPEVEIRLEGGTAVVVKLVDAQTGKLLSNANASVADGQGRFITGNMQRDEDGLKFYLQPGAYVLNAFAMGYVRQEKVPFSVPSPDVRVALQRGGAVAFVTSEARKVRLVAPGLAKPAYQGTAVPNVGLASAQNLAPGAYLAEILGKGDVVQKSIPVTVIAGETVTVRLD